MNSFFGDLELTLFNTLLANYPTGKRMVRLHLINEYLRTNSWDTRNILLLTIKKL